MVLKAVCVLKGAGETNGTVFFEQEVMHDSPFFTEEAKFGLATPETTRKSDKQPHARVSADMLKWLAWVPVPKQGAELV